MKATVTRYLAGLVRGVSIALALWLAACTSTPDTEQVPSQLPQLTLPHATAQVEQASAEQREHQRILATYGGIYKNPHLHAMISKMVDRLVAASERPNLKYEVTLLDSPAINAFALPNGHLYVTRGLILLANDKSELASVLAHEMGHVIARHAAIRARQPRGQRSAQRPANGRVGARQIEAGDGELLARAGIRSRRHRRRHLGTRRLRSLWRFAISHRYAAQCRTQDLGPG
jgi:predicted Zn-dependent protease